LNILELEIKLPEYTKQIEQYFLGLDKEKLTLTDYERLKRVMITHKNIVKLINENKKEISNNIKQLHTGKKMQNTYPLTTY
jgi:Na+/phosphate symporter